MNSIGDKIKYMRKQKSITQEEQADVLHISFQVVSKWENGNVQPDISVIPVIANYFGVTILPISVVFAIDLYLTFVNI